MIFTLFLFVDLYLVRMSLLFLKSKDHNTGRWKATSIVPFDIRTGAVTAISYMPLRAQVADENDEVFLLYQRDCIGRATPPPCLLSPPPYCHTGQGSRMKSS